MGFAVSHIENASRIDEHAMRPREPAPKRIRLGAVSPLTGAEHRRDDAGRELDAANDVVFRVGHIEVAAAICEPFGAREPGTRAGPSSPE